MKQWLAGVALVLVASTAQAVDIPLQWKAVDRATDYFIEISTDSGATWIGKKFTGPLTADAQGFVSWTYPGAPETGLVMFRCSSQNAAGVATKTEGGAWYDHTKKLPQAPTKVSSGD